MDSHAAVGNSTGIPGALYPVFQPPRSPARVSCWETTVQRDRETDADTVLTGPFAAMLAPGHVSPRETKTK